ncbi:hypothetical protein ACFFSH_29735 [Streptomyces filamentosus]|uniref:hypothetical protein n=1 Tax=Streptomyces filamentosus TaxID=67294 RepID=UPI00167603A4|nr:hypothetical protein [Streptomyces filamentosus]
MSDIRRPRLLRCTWTVGRQTAARAQRPVLGLAGSRGGVLVDDELRLMPPVVDDEPGIVQHDVTSLR